MDDRDETEMEAQCRGPHRLDADKFHSRYQQAADIPSVKSQLDLARSWAAATKPRCVLQGGPVENLYFEVTNSETEGEPISALR